MLISRTPTRTLGVALLALPGLAATGAQEPFEVTQEAVERVLEQVVPAVEAELGTHLDVTARLATTLEIALVLKEENTPLMAAQLGSAEAGEASAGAFGRTAAPALLAKYAFAGREILVNAENFERTATILDRDDINSEAMLRAVLVHELVHLADDERYGFSDTLLQIETGAGVAAYSAVFEGHAQFVARRVCETHGWTPEFERFCENIGYLPEELLEDLDPLTVLTARVAASDARTSYHAGERFIAELFAAGGEPAVERAFNEPPTELQLILNPGWYLDPSSRPTSVFELQAALDRFQVLNQQPGWDHVRAAVLKPQMKAALTGLPLDLTSRALDSIVSAHSDILTLGRGEKLVMAFLYETASEPEAAGLVDISRQLTQHRDAGLHTGDVELLIAEYTPLERAGAQGFVARKLLDYMGQDLAVTLAVFHNGPLVCELTYSNLEVGQEQAVLHARQLLALAQGRELPWGVESFDADEPPAEWGVLETAGTGTRADWSIQEDPTAPDGARVLQVVAANSGHTFNLLVDWAYRPADLSVRVQLRADAGVEDQGGGLCWRLRDEDNYYVTRWNPLEDNLRVYKVEDGVRHELQSADVHIDRVGWHALEASMVGTHISVRLDGEELLSIDDETFTDGGRAGLWTKADASVSFDAFGVR